MAWSKVDDRLFAHPKVLAAGVAAMGLWVMAQSYSSCYGTDGNVPMATVALLCSNSGLPSGTEPLLLADKLVEVGLWERTEQGYQFHDWGQYNPTRTRQASEKTGVRLSRSEAGKLGAAKRWGAKAEATDGKNGKPDGKMAMAFAIGNDSPVPVPDPIPNKEGGARNVSSSPVGSVVLPAPPPTEPVQSELPPTPPEVVPPTDETEPPPRGEVSPEIKLGTKVCRIFEDFSGGVISSLNFTTAHFYRVGVVAKELREQHNIGSEQWMKLARWLGPRGPGLKGRDKPVSLELLLRNDAAWLRDCMSEAIKWNESAGYNGRS